MKLLATSSSNKYTKLKNDQILSKTDRINHKHNVLEKLDIEKMIGIK